MGILNRLFGTTELNTQQERIEGLELSLQMAQKELRDERDAHRMESEHLKRKIKELERMVEKPKHVGPDEKPEIFINGRKALGITYEDIFVSRMFECDGTTPVNVIRMSFCVDKETIESMFGNQDSYLIRNANVHFTKD